MGLAQTDPFFKDFIYFIFRERGREGEGREKHPCERETLISCLSCAPQPGALTQESSRRPFSLWGNQLSHAAQGADRPIECDILPPANIWPASGGKDIVLILKLLPPVRPVAPASHSLATTAVIAPVTDHMHCWWWTCGFSVLPRASLAGGLCFCLLQARVWLSCRNDPSLSITL